MIRYTNIFVNPQLLQSKNRLNDLSEAIDELKALGVWTDKGIEYDDCDHELMEKIRVILDRIGL